MLEITEFVQFARADQLLFSAIDAGV